MLSDEILIKYYLAGGAGDGIKELVEEHDVTLKEFRAWVQAHHHLPGLLTLSVRDHLQTDLMKLVKDVLKTPTDIICVHVNEKIMVASGGVGKGGVASSTTTGRMAFAEGGFGGGGSYDGRTLHGGKGMGGDSRGSLGSGGDALGGTANSTMDGVRVKAGRTTGGQFQLH